MVTPSLPNSNPHSLIAHQSVRASRSLQARCLRSQLITHKSAMKNEKWKMKNGK
jgi:hypothetical protein